MNALNAENSKTVQTIAARIAVALAFTLAAQQLAAQVLIRLPIQVVEQSKQKATDEEKPTEKENSKSAETPKGDEAPTKPKVEDPTFSKGEIERLKVVYESLSDVEKEEMRAYYAALDVKLDELLGLEEKKQKSLIDEIRALDFSREPEKVLAARSKLGFAPPVMPVMSETKEAAEWLHMNVMAGEWQVLPDFLGMISKDDATAAYSHILRSTNKGDGALLPEEVLALADACPGDIEEWQLDVICQLLRRSSSQYGKQLILDRLRAGTTHFGPQDDEHRKLTARLLVGGGMALEAREFLPPIEKAREEKDAHVIYAHARYFEDLVDSGRAADAEQSQLQAWHLFADVTLMESAKVDLRKDAMQHAIDHLTDVPPAQASEWLSTVFSNSALGPAALEIVALKAVSFADEKAGSDTRAKGLSVMKAAVDTLLSQPDVDMHALRVPMRMLTSALADAVDQVVKSKGAKRGVAEEATMLLRAAPGERWLSAIEPSLAIRGYRAAIAIATICDETDLALDTLSDAVTRFPRASVDLADGFLKLWIGRLNPSDGGGNQNMYFYYYWQRMPAAPLTRGRQRRNLDRLERLVSLMQARGISAKDLPSVTDAFKACHARTEVFQRDQIERVFGPVNDLPAATAATLATTMRDGLSGDWRSRQAQQSLGMRRSRAEISELVEVGYALAIELASHARDLEPDSWRHAVLCAAINYDHLRYRQTQKQEDFATFNEVRRQAFSAFEQAANRYAELVTQGVERDDAGVYLTWFAAVMDAGEPVSEDIVKEQEANEDQLERIATCMRKLPQAAYDRHIGAFAREVISTLDNVPPEKKPTIVKAAAKIVGDHPAGAPLRNQNELYRDLLKDEIRLRLMVDGDDSLAADRLFAVTLTLRYTNSVDREVGGFDKYLYQDAYAYIGGRFQSVNFQQKLRQSIEGALSDSFSVESIGFFEPLTPSRAVTEEGQLDWQEKPMAYILLKANDPSVDRIPAVSFDMHFDDQSGPVTLPVTSNSPPIDASGKPTRRPIRKLKVEQVVDTRRVANSTDDAKVTVEVSARGEGVVPEIKELLSGLSDALPGYRIADDGIQANPYYVVQSDAKSDPFAFAPSATDEKKEFATPDENGIYRLPTERSWVVTYTPTGDAVGQAFNLPELQSGLEGELVSRTYADMDIVPVEGRSVAVSPGMSSRSIAAMALAIPVLIAVVVLLRRRLRPIDSVESGDWLAVPERLTPLSTLVTLRRIEEAPNGLSTDQRASLAHDIDAVERAHFAPNGNRKHGTDELRGLLERWVTAANRQR